MPSTDPAASASRRRWQALVGTIVSVVLLAWVLRGTNLHGLLREVRAARAAPLAAAVVIATLSFPLRLIRWRLLLRADDDTPLPVTPLWHAVAMGFMANNLLPFRAGEVIRCYAAAKLTGTRFAAALSSVVVERLFDGLTVVSLLAFAFFAAHLPPTVVIGGRPVSVAHAATSAGALSAVALLLALSVVVWPLAAERLIRRLVPVTGAADRLVAIIEGVRHGFVALRSPARLAAVAAWSAVIWLVNAAAFYVAFGAFDLPVDYAGALLLQGLLVFGIAVPSTPGFIGVFEAVIGAVLLLYGVGPDRAAAYALVYHLTTFIPITLLGLWSVSRTSIGLGEMRRSAA